MTRLLSTVIGAQTSTQGGDTVANTAAATNFATSHTLAASMLNVAGRVLHIHCAGTCTNAGLGQTIRLAVLFGTNTIVSLGSFTPTDVSGATDNWFLEADMICRSTGATGTVWGTGNLFMTTGVLKTLDGIIYSAGSPVTIDLTAAQTIYIEAKWSGALAANSITMDEFITHLGGTS